jgi:protein ImuB
LDITGLAHLFGGEAALVEKVVQHFVRRGLTVRAAAADTIGAAWAVAHYKGDEGQGAVVPTAAKRPATTNHPSSFMLRPSPCALRPAFFLVPPGETPSALRPLPLEALRLPQETVELLHQLGIWWIGQLEALPRAGLSARFGPHLLERWDQALGQRAEPLPAHQSPPRFEAHWSPEYPTARRETIEAAVVYLLGRIVALLIQQGRGALRLECRLYCTAGDPLQITVGLFQPAASIKHLGQLVQVQLEQVRLPAPLRAVSITASATAPLARRQQELFSDAWSRRNPRYLADLIDRLSNRLGRHAVVRGRLVPEAQPELAYQYVSLVDGGGRRSSRRTVPADLPPRPLRLLVQPAELRGYEPPAADVLPTCPLPEQPRQFQFSGQQHQVARTWGPERIETGWWRGRAVSRDYYRVETTTGRRYWLFRQLRAGKWFLHGMFE